MNFNFYLIIKTFVAVFNNLFKIINIRHLKIILKNAIKREISIRIAYPGCIFEIRGVSHSSEIENIKQNDTQAKII